MCIKTPNRIGKASLVKKNTRTDVRVDKASAYANVAASFPFPSITQAILRNNTFVKMLYGLPRDIS